MKYYKDLTGMRFGRLRALYRNGTDKKGYVIWHCKCDCGNECDVVGRYLTSGGTTSCGCYRRELKQNQLSTHGGTDTRLYRVFLTMLGRCHNPNAHEYENYGGRGITVCEGWHSFEHFRTWAIANGYDETAKHGECTLDRIDPNKGYSPENCRWVSMKVQQRNRRNNVLLTYEGETHCVAEWAEKVGLQAPTLRHRLKAGWPIKSALQTSVNR